MAFAEAASGVVAPAFRGQMLALWGTFAVVASGAALASEVGDSV